MQKWGDELCDATGSRAQASQESFCASNQSFFLRLVPLFTFLASSHLVAVTDPGHPDQIKKAQFKFTTVTKWSRPAGIT